MVCAVVTGKVLQDILAADAAASITTTVSHPF
jgi:hypothetical protein